MHQTPSARVGAGSTSSPSETMANASLRQRMGISEANAAIASRIIADAVQASLIKLKDPDSTSRKYRAYVPFWA